MTHKILTSIILSVIVAACCGPKDTASGVKVKKDNSIDFTISYYTVGGFTGRSDGITVYSNGSVNYWSGINAANSIVKDSLKIDNDKINELSDLLQDSTIFTFKYSEKGNLTTVLTISSGNKSNRITYSGTSVPKEFPKEITDLIKELNRLLNKK